MSQFPNYFSPPPPGPSPDDLLGPARRAGTMMIIVGVLAVVSGLCVAYQANQFDPTDPRAIPDPQLRQQMQQQINLFESQLGISFRALMIGFAAVPLLLGAVAGGVGLSVRNGGLAAVVVGIVVAAIMLLGVGLILLTGLIQGAAMGPAVMALSVCFYGVPFAMLVMQLFWLVQAARAAPRVEAARNRQQAAQWQSEERQQTFRQGPGATYGGPPMQPGQPMPPGQQPPQPPRSGLGYSYPPPPQQPENPPVEPKDRQDDAPPQ